MVDQSSSSHPPSRLRWNHERQRNISGQSLLASATNSLASSSSSSRRTGGNNSRSWRMMMTGWKLRHAMTILLLLTMVMATGIIFLSSSSSSSSSFFQQQHPQQQQQPLSKESINSHHDDPKLNPQQQWSPLAQALSSSSSFRRRNLSQLLPPSSNEKQPAETNDFKTISEKKTKKKIKGTAKDDDEQITKQAFQRRQQNQSLKKQGNDHKTEGTKKQGIHDSVKVSSEKSTTAKTDKGTTTTQSSHSNLSDRVVLIPSWPQDLPPQQQSDKQDDEETLQETIQSLGNIQRPMNWTPNAEEAIKVYQTNYRRHEKLKKKMKFFKLQKAIQSQQRRPKMGGTPGMDPVIPVIDDQPSMGGTPGMDPVVFDALAGQPPPEVQERHGAVKNMKKPQQQNEPVPDQDEETRNPIDPLMANATRYASFWKESVQSLDIYPQSQYLGVLVDAGRHYFPIPWLKTMVRYLHRMNYNFIHFRLTDDQTFNINLTSQPQLASPVAYNNPNHLVYTKEQLLDLVRFAHRHNITIMPEINVPGHAGSWAGVPGLVVNCPEFVCQKGYGVPINVTHPQLESILTDILREVRQVFYTSPYLHLGGDEVHMAQPCFDELQSRLFDYGPFETMLKRVLRNLNISDDYVLRWEMTGQQIRGRAGKMNHFWESNPGERMNTSGPYFISNGLYFDTNGRDRAYDVYVKTRKQLYNDFAQKAGWLRAIIVGTFELDADFWFQRNVMGRLIGVAMGASGRYYRGPHMVVGEANEEENREKEDSSLSATNTTTKKAPELDFTSEYLKYCQDYLRMDSKVCRLLGEPLLDQNTYYSNWQGAWSVWKQAICHRMTYPEDVRAMTPTYNWRTHMMERINQEFWRNFGRGRELVHFPNGSSAVVMVPPKRVKPFLHVTNVQPIILDTTKMDQEYRIMITKLRQEHVITHTGVILDLVNSNIPVERIERIMDVLALLGFNLVQLRLANDYGYMINVPFSQGDRLADRRPIMDSERHPQDSVSSYTKMELARIVHYAEHRSSRYTTSLGGSDVMTNQTNQQQQHRSDPIGHRSNNIMKVMPEISISTNVGGWHKVGFTLSCPHVLCDVGYGIANHIGDPDLLPFVGSLVRDLRMIFSSELIHLGSDEREQSVACFNESQTVTSFNMFEHKLTTLLELEGVDLNHVLRWENHEQKRYKGRAGKITHFRPLVSFQPSSPLLLSSSSSSRQQQQQKQSSTNMTMAIRQSRIPRIRLGNNDMEHGGEDIFGTVDIFQQGHYVSAWDVYQQTRAWVTKLPHGQPPLGLLAELRFLFDWEARYTFGRLLAFAMGVSSLTPYTTEEKFRNHYINLCHWLVNATVGQATTTTTIIQSDDCQWYQDSPPPPPVIIPPLAQKMNQTKKGMEEEEEPLPAQQQHEQQQQQQRRGLLQQPIEKAKDEEEEEDKYDVESKASRDLHCEAKTHLVVKRRARVHIRAYEI